MDNLTHTLTGLVVADLALQIRSRLSRGSVAPPAGDTGSVTAPQVSSPARFRSAAFATSAIANNTPDLDFIYTGITGGKLGYLLHHRGHTHTLVLAAPLALACVGCVALVLRARGTVLDAAQRRMLFLLALAGGVLHVAMDFGNNYGVHPFWPFDNAWYYGDAVFIVEPWIAILLAGSAFAATRSRVLRGLLLLCVAGLLALAWTSELGGKWLTSMLAAFAVAWFGWVRRAGAAHRLWATFALTASFLVVSLLSRERAHALLERELGPAAARTTFASTPSPGNPLCWWVLATSKADATYSVRQALVAPWSTVLGAERCRWPSSGSTAPLGPVRSAETPGVRWGGEFRAPLAELRKTASSDCRARALLRFARVPFWIERDGRTHVIGDLRYDRSPSIDFAELMLSPGAPCPRFEPPWEPPLQLEPQ